MRVRHWRCPLPVPASNDAQRVRAQVRERSGANATSRSASSMARLTRAASSRAHHTPHDGGALEGLRGTASDVCASPQASPPEVATLMAAGSAMFPVALTGTRDSEHRSRARTSRRLRHPEVAPGASISRQARDRYAAPDASSVHDRGSETTSLGLS
jgi:hypothetical protein